MLNFNYQFGHRMEVVQAFMFQPSSDHKLSLLVPQSTLHVPIRDQSKKGTALLETLLWKRGLGFNVCLQRSTFQMKLLHQRQNQDLAALPEGMAPGVAQMALCRFMVL